MIRRTSGGGDTVLISHPTAACPSCRNATGRIEPSGACRETRPCIVHASIPSNAASIARLATGSQYFNRIPVIGSLDTARPRRVPKPVK